MSIASEITDLNTNLNAAKNAVTTKGGTVGDTGLAGLASEIASIPSGGSSSVTPKDINFYDYDGTLVESWDLSELSSKTALPDAPTHDGLTSDGWNWTLVQLQTQNTPMNVGHHYTPTDGKTHLFVSVDADHLSPTLGLGVNGTVNIDWGDGTTGTLSGSDTNSGVTTSHTYDSAGDYEVKIEVPSGTSANVRGNTITTHLWRNSNFSSVNADTRTYNGQLKEVWFGNNTGCGTGSMDYPFQSCFNLEKVCFPLSTLTAPNTVIFNKCCSIKFVSIPTGMIKASLGEYNMFEAVSLPPTMEWIQEYCFSYNYVIKNICIPDSVSFLGNYSFRNQDQLQTVLLPKNLGTISQGTFKNCGSVRLFDLSKVTAVPTLGSNGLPTASDGLVIKVPSSLLASFQSASNWSSYSSYMIGV